MRTRASRIPAFLFFLITVFPAASEEPLLLTPEGSGPLYSTSMFFPYVLFAQLSGFPAEIAAPGSITLSGTLYLTNDMVIYSHKTAGVTEYYTIQDYEGLTLEGNISRGFEAGFEAGATLRLFLYYGGFLDPVIEGFHGLFGFPNGGREQFDQNRVDIDLENNNGLEIRQKGTLFALGDTDLWIKAPLVKGDRTLMTGLVLIKCPTGALSGASVISTGYPDLLLAALAEFHPYRLFSFYFQTGVTLPGQLFNPEEEVKPFPHLSALFAVEFHPTQRWSVIAQLNVKTPVLSGSIGHWYWSEVDRLILPQTDLLFGVVLNSELDRWQLFFTENFLTNAGSDITFGLRYTRNFRSKP